jgi:hypothetical protein
MVYEVILNATAGATASVSQGFFSLLWQRTVDLIKAPVNTPEMFWILTPLIIATVIMQFYFGRYEDEEMGWNTAVSNSLILIFVSIDLLRHLHTNPPSEVLFNLFGINIYTKTIMVAVLAFIGFFLFITDFFHFLPKRTALFASSGLIVRLLSYVALVVVYSANIPIDLMTMLGGVLIFIMLFFIFQFIRFIEPKAKER